MGQILPTTIYFSNTKSSAIAYITGEGTCQGIPDLRIGKVVEITGVGKRFSGLYYLSSTEHHYEKTQGYKTSFTVRRTAL